MFGSSSSQGNPNGDPELSNPPSDTVSSVAWSSKANFIVGASWDKTIRCWEVQCQGKDKNFVDVTFIILDGTEEFQGDKSVQSKMLKKIDELVLKLKKE